MKATLLMATSANGFIARRDGDEDFLPNENWKQMLSCVEEHGNLIWGRKTYEAVASWGKEYLDDLKSFPLIVVSESKKSFSESNVSVCSSPEEAIRIVGSKNYRKPLLSGGASLNTSFVENNLVDEVILNYNPIILADGIKLFSESDFEMKLSLKKIDELSSGVVQLHYSVVDVLPDKSAL